MNGSRIDHLFLDQSLEDTLTGGVDLAIQHCFEGRSQRQRKPRYARE